ncbi:MAG TPA: PadR family transcriptional regulator [Phycisphaerales bacterium]|nr:PadR family transcriptional regulator [Phycisphaerales bacterium]
MLNDQPKDAAELIVLSLLAEGQQYGYAISKEVAARSGGQVRLTPGVLYPLLKGLETQGLVLTSWEEVKAEDSEEGRKRKWYRLSAKGKKRLEQRIAAHKAFRAVIDAFIHPGEAGQEVTR